MMIQDDPQQSHKEFAKTRFINWEPGHFIGALRAVGNLAVPHNL